MQYQNKRTIWQLAIILMLLMGYSLVMQNEKGLIIRFTLILFFLLGAYLTNISCKVNLLKILIYVAVSFSVLLIVSELILLLFVDTHNAGVVRMFFRDGGMGDVYYYHFYYKIQIRGNSILPFVYMLVSNIDLFPSRRKFLFRTLLMLGVVVAGNFAFLVTIVVYHIVFYFINSKNNKHLVSRIFTISCLVIVFSGILFSHVEGVLKEKGEESNVVRLDQTKVLLHNIKETPITFLFGQGLGNTVDVVTQYRDYREAVYYELQMLYFLNQLGVIPFLIFVLINIYFTNKYLSNSRLKLIYLFYILYAITNPYILDTNHVVVIIALLATQQYIRENEKNNLCISSVQSRLKTAS